MNKLFVFFVVGLLTMSFAFAAQSDNAGGAEITDPVLGEAGQENSPEAAGNIVTATQNMGEESKIQTQQQTETGNPGIGEQAKVMAKEQIQDGSGNGKYVNNAGQEVQLKNENGMNLKVGNVEAKSSLELKAEQNQEKTETKLKTTLSNGKDAEIKIMPDTASERAIERLQLKNCVAEEGCTIELKEVGKGNEIKAAYEVKAEKEARFLAIFRTRMKVQAQIDAETGEVINVDKPWWAFLASEPVAEEVAAE